MFSLSCSRSFSLSSFSEESLCEDREKVTIYKSRREASKLKILYRHLDFGSLTSRTVRKCVSLPARDVLLGQPRNLKQRDRGDGLNRVSQCFHGECSDHAQDLHHKQSFLNTHYLYTSLCVSGKTCGEKIFRDVLSLLLTPVVSKVPVLYFFLSRTKPLTTGQLF